MSLSTHFGMTPHTITDTTKTRTTSRIWGRRARVSGFGTPASNDDEHVSGIGSTLLPKLRYPHTTRNQPP